MIFSIMLFINISFSFLMPNSKRIRKQRQLLISKFWVRNPFVLLNILPFLKKIILMYFMIKYCTICKLLNGDNILKSNVVSSTLIISHCVP